MNKKKEEKEKRDGLMDIYEPESEILELKILVEEPKTYIGEPYSAPTLLQSLLSKVGLSKNKGNGKDEGRKYRNIRLHLISAAPKKIFEYLKLTLSAGDNLKKILGAEEGETTQETIIEDVYIEAINESLKFIAHSDDVIRLIVDDMKPSDGLDFIPYLSSTQRIAIVESFWRVNPILGEAQKKVQEISVSMKQMIDSMTDELESGIGSLEQEQLSKKLKSG